jgi:hypothetical protein
LSSATGSIQLWFSPDDSAQLDLVFITPNGCTATYLLVRKKSNNKITVLIKDNSVIKVYRTSDNAVTVDAWHHLAVTQETVHGLNLYRRQPGKRHRRRHHVQRMEHKVL